MCYNTSVNARKVKVHERHAAYRWNDDIESNIGLRLSIRVFMTLDSRNVITHDLRSEIEPFKIAPVPSRLLVFKSKDFNK